MTATPPSNPASKSVSVSPMNTHSSGPAWRLPTAMRPGRARVSSAPVGIIAADDLSHVRVQVLPSEVGGNCGAGVIGNDGDGAAGLGRCDDQLGRSWRGPCCLDRADFERGEQLLHGDRDQVAEAADVFARSIPGPGGAGASKSASKKSPTGRARGR